jgi:Mlc titration factor MtfA (ptsG expression regulator)
VGGRSAPGMFGFLKNRRRNRIRNRPFPSDWRDLLVRRYPLYSRLPPADRRELEGLIQVFLAEKRFEGCGGQEITDEVRVLIAAQACLLLLHRETDCYPRLHSILVYPSSYVAPTWHLETDGMTITEGAQVRGGESWAHGTVVLAWDGVFAGAVELEKNRNLVLHEFAHQLDEEDGRADGAPFLSGPDLRQIHYRYQAWARVLNAEFQQLRHAAEAGRETVLDTYGAQNPAEFFAVATECFFERPRRLLERHPALYAELKQFYRQDPVLYAATDPVKNETST